MAGPRVFNRVLETSITTGTGAFALAGAVPGYQRFSAVLSVADTCHYCISSQGGTEWEVGLGTYSATNTLTRTTVYSSSNSGSAVNFSAGNKDVFLCHVAERAVLKAGALTSGRVPYINSNGDLTDSAEFQFTASQFSVGSRGVGLGYKQVITDEGFTTAGIVPVLAVGYNSTGTPAAGLGPGILLMAESTTTENREQALIASRWVVATEASRAADLILYAYSTSTNQEGIRVRGNSGGVQLGFFAVTPVARPGTTDDIKDALTNLGLLQGTSATPLNLDGGKLTCDEAEIDGALNHDGTTIGFFGTTPASQASAYTQTYSTATKTHSNPTATLTDNTGGTVDGTLASFGVGYNQARANDNAADTAAAINALITDLNNLKQVVNSIIDDLQGYGIVL